jgi:hypothetical protein
VSPRTVTLTGYVVLLVSTLALVALGHVRASGVQTLSTVLGRVMRTRAGRVGMLAAWAWLGLHYFAR